MPSAAPSTGAPSGAKHNEEASEGPVRYASGEIQLGEMDLVSGGYGLQWGHTRIYSNQMSDDYNYGNGYNWLVLQWSYLVQSGSTITVVRGTQSALWFDLVGGVYVARFGAKETLTADATNHLFRLLLPNGELTEFQDFTQTTNPQGLFYRQTTAGGQQLSVVSYTGQNIGEVQRSYTDDDGVATTESYQYDYLVSGPNSGNLQYVTLRRKAASGPWNNIRRFAYSYYESGADNGSLGDLQTATLQLLVGAAWQDQDVHYYRYWTDSAGGIGMTHGLKYVVSPDAYVRLSVDPQVSDPLTATDAQVAAYANLYLEYNSDRRVTKESLDGGTKTYTFAFTTSSHADGYNSWKRKTVESRPDGSQNIVYTNYIGQVMLRDLTSGTDHWLTYDQMDANGYVIQHALPSAITGYDDTNADLSVAIRSADGLIYIYTYYSTTGSGAAEGYLEYKKIQRGSGGTPILQEKYEYTSNTVGSDTIYPLSKSTVYRNDDGTGEIDTSFSYTFHTGTNQVLQKSTTLPAVPTGQNGSGSSDTIWQRFDLHGNLQWLKDARGFIAQNVYDVILGNLVQTIQDVDGAQVTLPSGWSTPSGGGLNLITDYENDMLGRRTQSLGPVHDVDGQSVRTANWTAYLDEHSEVRSAVGYATGLGSNLTYTLVNPVSITRMDDNGRVTDQIAAVRATTCGQLAGCEDYPQSSWVRWTSNSYDDDNHLTATRVYYDIPENGTGTEGVNYDETTFDYDLMDRRNKVRSPGGTITRTVFDVRDQSVEVYIGTNDAGATDADPTGGGAVGNNMVLVRSNEYDSGADGGDGNLTQQTLPVDANAANDRVTSFLYDWRNRQTDIEGEVDFYQITVYDNLNQVIRVDRHNTNSGGNLIARSDTKWDDLGRVYQRIRYGVDPSSGTVGNSLTDNIWYDGNGNLIKDHPAGSNAFTKKFYDGLNRAYAQFVGYDLDETTYAEATTVTGDTIFEQVYTTYDAANNTIETNMYQRFHDATGTGALNDPSGSQPKSRVTYVTNYYDGAGRPVATANYGTNDNAPITRLSVVPDRSDDILVSTISYDGAGNAVESIDPAAKATRTDFDDAGRPIQIIDNYITVSGDCFCPGADQNITVRRTYTADGNLATLTAKNSATGDQTTMYVYGTTLSDSEIASSILLRAEVYPDSADASDRVTYSVNRQGEITSKTDQRGVVHSYDYDKLARQTQDRVTTLASGADGTVLRISTTYEVRGMPVHVTSYDHATVGSGSAVNDVQREYNDFEQLSIEYQEHGGAVNTSTTPHVEYDYADGSTNSIRPIAITYPNGRVLNYDYGSSGGDDDSLSRIGSLVDNDGTTHLVDYTYIGLGSFVRADYAEPDVRWDLITGSGANPYAGWDRFGRVIDCLWQTYSGTPTDLDRVQYGYDRASNLSWRNCPVANVAGAHLDELYRYDGAERLQDFNRGDLSASKDVITNLAVKQTWSLDATGNWQNFLNIDASTPADSLSQDRTANAANEISSLSRVVGANWVTPVYDRTGNMSTIPQPTDPSSSFTATWDAWNRLVHLADGTTTVGQYAYDGSTRRIKKIVPGTTHHVYYSDQWQVLEERLGTSPSSATAERQFVWGLRYIDDLVERDRETGGGGMLNERLYAVQDSNWNVTALSNVTGEVQERFTYSAYGEPTFLTSSFGSRIGSAFGWDRLLAAYTFDIEGRLYNIRNRTFAPALGWMQRDPMNVFNSPNLYQYAIGNPLNRVDPSGLIDEIPTGWEGETLPSEYKQSHGGWGSCKSGEPCPVLRVKMYKWWNSARIRRFQLTVDKLGLGKPGSRDFSPKDYNGHIDQLAGHIANAIKCWLLYQKECMNCGIIHKPHFKRMPNRIPISRYQPVIPWYFNYSNKYDTFADVGLGVGIAGTVIAVWLTGGAILRGIGPASKGVAIAGSIGGTKAIVASKAAAVAGAVVLGSEFFDED